MSMITSASRGRGALHVTKKEEQGVRERWLDVLSVEKNVVERFLLTGFMASDIYVLKNVLKNQCLGVLLKHKENN